MIQFHSLHRCTSRGVNWFDKTILHPLRSFPERSEQGKRSVVVITGDHRGSINSVRGPQTFYHRGEPKRNLIRVPGNISGSNLDPEVFRNGELTSLVDFAPTIAELFDLDVNPQVFSGFNLLDQIPDQSYVFSDFSNQSGDGFSGKPSFSGIP